MLTICCVCNKTKHKNAWVNEPLPEDIIFSHGYCPQCYEKQKQKIANFFKKNTIFPTRSAEVFIKSRRGAI